MKNIWQKLKEEKKEKPILCLAPMADVTDRAFRQIIAKYSKVSRTRLDTYITWTEFVSADGLFLGGYDALINDLSFTESERPIIAQFFTSKPEMMEKASKLAVELGFDGIDINMGCPDKSVEKQGAGASLIKNPNLAKEIILAAKQGAQRSDLKKGYKDQTLGIPVSVKTRIGYNKNELEEWLPNLLETNPSVITIHARTRKEMSLVPARWEHIKRAVEIRDEFFKPKVSRTRLDIRGESKKGNKINENFDYDVSRTRLDTLKEEKDSIEKTLIFGNGDVLSVEDAYKKTKMTGCDGVMLGRAIFGNPWLFSEHIPSIEEKLKVLIEHSKLFEEIVQPKSPNGQGKSFAVMKKHFKAYVEGFNGAKELRIKLMDTNNSKEVEQIINIFLKNNKEYLLQSKASPLKGRTLSLTL